LVDFYPAILKFEGEAIPYLLEISMNKNSPLRFLALQLLREISAITKNRLEKGDYSKFLCPNCFIRFSRNELQLPEGEILVCYGCRVCGRSKRLWKLKNEIIIVVLDKGMTDCYFRLDNVIKRNWLIQRKLFDFERVEIMDATDEDVERFLVQVGNNTDALQRIPYKQMDCFIAQDCKLSENTLRILSHVFGRINKFDNHYG
jgi:hypothetical protein